MNKEQLQAIVDNLNFSKEDYYILGSGTTIWITRYFKRFRPFFVTPQAFKELKSQYIIDMGSQNARAFYSLTPTIEVVVNEKKDFDLQDGYPVEKLEKILAFKQGRNKLKDKLDIENTTKYLEQRNIIKQL